MLSLVMIYSLVKEGLIALENDLIPFCCYFSKVSFLAYFVMLLYIFFSFYRSRSFP